MRKLFIIAAMDRLRLGLSNRAHQRRARISFPLSLHRKLWLVTIAYRSGSSTTTTHRCARYRPSFT